MFGAGINFKTFGGFVTFVGGFTPPSFITRKKIVLESL